MDYAYYLVPLNSTATMESARRAEETDEEETRELRGKSKDAPAHPEYIAILCSPDAMHIVRD